MFRVLEGKPFIMDRIHKDMFNVFDDLYYLRITRECMNIPPRAGKTTICKYWLIYCLTKNPRCNFIYTSFSQMLLSDIAREVAQILEHPIYKELYGNGLIGIEEKEENPIDDFWRDYLMQETGKAVYASKRIITAKGGQILFASIGSTITGFGAGIRGAKGFSGALICFPYDELVLTEKGYRKIGEIVENKEDIKVWSYNFEKERPELKRIERHIKNITPTKQCFVEVKLSNGKSFICTDNHKVWTKNRGYVEAKDLTSIDCVVTFSNPFYLVNTKVKNFCNFLSGNVLISDFFQSIRRKFNLFSGRIVNFFNKIFETFSIRGIKSFFFELNNSSFISASRKYISRAAYNISKIGNSIKSIISGDVFVNNISVVCHNHTSYCLTVYENHNLYVGKCRVLVSNCDDANKPADIQSEVMREKVRKYYDETLLSRLNDSNVPIFNIQQRLHLGDLSGYLLEQYKFDSIIKPLLEPDGTCNIASQYTPERIKEISFNDTMFQAQYQQSPVAEKGNIIQRDWWGMYDADHTPIDGKLIITADTAYKKTKTADYSCFQVWELLRKEMRLRDMIVGKWEFPELLEKATQIWRKWTDDSLINPAAFMYIEDKASGISLEQTLIQSGINAICWKPKEYDYPEDKVGRTRELSWDVYRGLVKLKKDDKMSQYLVNEAALFAEDMSHKNDDSVDSASMAHSIWRYAGGGQ